MICMYTISVVNSFGKYVHVLPKLLDIIETINTIYPKKNLTILPTHNKTQKLS